MYPTQKALAQMIKEKVPKIIIEAIEIIETMEMIETMEQWNLGIHGNYCQALS